MSINRSGSDTSSQRSARPPPQPVPPPSSPSERASCRSQPDPPGAFKSYEDYVAYVDGTITQETNFTLNQELCLAQYSTDEQSIRWYQLTCDFNDKSAHWKDHGTGAGSFRSTGSVELFQDQLEGKSQSLSWQVLLFSCNPGGYQESIHGQHQWYSNNPLDGFIGVAGLALNLPLRVWDRLRIQLLNKGPAFGTEMATWTDDSSVLEIGPYSLTVLDAPDPTRPPTALVVLPLALDLLSHDPVNERNGFLQAIRPSCDALSHLNTPSTALSQSPSCAWRPAWSPAKREPLEAWYIRQAVERYRTRKDPLSLQDIVFACLTALLQIHLDKPSLHAPILEYERDRSGSMRLKHYKWPENSFLGREQLPVYRPTRQLWMRLRDEVDGHKMMLDNIQWFTRHHLQTLETDQQNALVSLLGRWRLRVTSLELMENNLRDRIAVYGSEKSTEMAERSIQESKRVILLTALAFVFLPVSLASSIYGMNIQQINETGHSIATFVITAVAMCATTVGIWGTIAKVASVRERLSREWTGKNGYPDSRLQRLILYGPRYSWGRLLFILRYSCKPVLQGLFRRRRDGDLSTQGSAASPTTEA